MPNNQNTEQQLSLTKSILLDYITQNNIDGQKLAELAENKESTYCLIEWIKERYENVEIRHEFYILR